MSVTDADITGFSQSYDIITLGVRADEIRRQRYGDKTTFVRVADLSADVGAPTVWPPAAGELRIGGTPKSRSAAIARVHEVVSGAGVVPVSAFSLADLEGLATRDGTTLRSVLEE